MQRNSDIKLYVVVNAVHPRRTAQLKEDLSKLGYDLPEFQKDAGCLLLDDLSREDFEINFYRDYLKKALENDQTILLLSQGVPFFCKYDGGLYFTKLHVDCYGSAKAMLSYHTENPPGYKSDIKPVIFIPGDRAIVEAIEWNKPYPPQRDKHSSCLRVWKGLYY